MSKIIDITPHLKDRQLFDGFEGLNSEELEEQLEFLDDHLDFDFEEDFIFEEEQEEVDDIWKSKVICEGNTEYWSITRNQKK